MVEITKSTTVVNINRNTINRNSKPGAVIEPPIRVAQGKYGAPQYGSEVAILGPAGEEVARFIYDPHGKIVPCGARLVLVAPYGARIIEADGATQCVDKSVE